MMQENPPLENLKMCVIKICSVLAPALLPYLHLGVVYQLWADSIRIPDRQTCTCSCWDTAFKGPYEKGIPRYKHVYFNVTPDTLKIWILTVLAVIVLYETLGRILKLLLTGGLRYSMLCLLVSVIYPHYYSWWMFFNYWNDGFYTQWNHQLLFSITEIISTIVVVNLLDCRTPPTPRKLLTVLSIAIFHILASGVDQFVANIFNMEGALHQILRDIGFMLPDILHVVLPLYELRQYAVRERTHFVSTVSRKEFVVCVGGISLALITCQII